MAKFAVYYVPDSRDDFYRLGSSVLGFDVRKQNAVETMEELRQISAFTEEWASMARPYGFHLTIGDAIDFNLSDMLRIERELEDLLGCFDPEHAFTLTQPKQGFVAFWDDAVVLRYNPNDHLKVFHAVIAARLHPLGTGSGYLRRFLEKRKEKQPYRIQRTVKFFSPTIFDSYSPHFTLLRPYAGKGQKRALSRLFSRKFASFKKLTIESICLFIQTDGGQNWRIHREFPTR